MKHGKKMMALLVGAAVLPAALILSGCRLTGDYYNSSRYRKAGIKAIEKRYDIDLTYIDDHVKPSGNVFGSRSEKLDINVKCDDLPDKVIEIYSADGKTFGSDYINKLYEDDTVSEIRSLAQEVYDDENIKVVIDKSFVNDLDTDTSLDGYLESGQIDFVMIMTTDSKDIEGDYAKYMDKMIERRINCSPSVYYFTEYVYGDDDVNVALIDNGYKIGRMAPESIYSTLDENFKKDYTFIGFF